MSRRPLQPRHNRDAGVQANRMAPGGRLHSESEIRELVPFIGDAGEEPVVPPVVEVQAFWWKFDEASGVFFNDEINPLDGALQYKWNTTTYPLSLHQSPLAPDSSYSVTLTASAQGNGSGGSLPFPIVSGSTGWIVFDWWMRLGISAGSNPNNIWLVTNWGLTMVIAHQHPSLIFGLGSTLGTPLLTLSSWASPGHYQWRIHPGSGAWQVSINDIIVGSGTHTMFTLWDMVRSIGVSVGAEYGMTYGESPSSWDEFRIWGE